MLSGVKLDFPRDFAGPDDVDDDVWEDDKEEDPYNNHILNASPEELLTQCMHNTKVFAPVAAEGEDVTKFRGNQTLVAKIAEQVTLVFNRF
jgi:hypothetical protein